MRFLILHWQVQYDGPTKTFAGPIDCIRKVRHSTGGSGDMRERSGDMQNGG